jgi:hypothetical protein
LGMKPVAPAAAARSRVWRSSVVDMTRTGTGWAAAAGTRPQPGPVDLVGAEAEQLEGPEVGLDRLRALRAWHPGQALAHHQGGRRGDQERLDVHVDEPADRRGRVVGVQGGEHQVPGHRRLHGDGSGLGVAVACHPASIGRRGPRVDGRWRPP